MQAHETVPIVPLRDVVLFPHMTVPFIVGRPSSTRALEHALGKDKRIFLAAQHDAAVDDPQPADIYTMGCVANIVQSLKLPDGNIKVLVQGVDRARAVEWKKDEGFYDVVVNVIAQQREARADLEATMGRVVSLFERYIKLSNNLNYDAMVSAIRVDDPGTLADTIAAHLAVAVDEKQNLLEIISPIERLNRIAAILEIEVEKVTIERRVQSRVEKQLETLRAEYYLAERRKAIQSEVDELKSKVDSPDTPQDLRAKAAAELERLEAISKIPDREIRVPDDFELPDPFPRLPKRGRHFSQDEVQPMLREQAQGREEWVPSPQSPSEEERTKTAMQSSAPPLLWIVLVAAIICGGLMVVGLWLLAS